MDSRAAFLTVFRPRRTPVFVPACEHAVRWDNRHRDERGMSRRLIREHPLLLRPGVRNSRPGECRLARPCVRAAGSTGHATIPEEVATCSPRLTASRSPIAHVSPGLSTFEERRDEEWRTAVTVPGWLASSSPS